MMKFLSITHALQDGWGITVESKLLNLDAIIQIEVPYTDNRTIIFHRADGKQERVSYHNVGEAFIAYHELLHELSKIEHKSRDENAIIAILCQAQVSDKKIDKACKVIERLFFEEDWASCGKLEKLESDGLCLKLEKELGHPISFTDEEIAEAAKRIGLSYKKEDGHTFFKKQHSYIRQEEEVTHDRP